MPVLACTARSVQFTARFTACRVPSHSVTVCSGAERRQQPGAGPGLGLALVAESLLLQEAAPEHAASPPLEGSATRRPILGGALDLVTLNCVGCLGGPRPAALGAWPDARGGAEVLGGVEGRGRGLGGARGGAGLSCLSKGPRDPQDLFPEGFHRVAEREAVEPRRRAPSWEAPLQAAGFRSFP